jgi:hypothetical protein
MSDKDPLEEMAESDSPDVSEPTSEEQIEGEVAETFEEGLTDGQEDRLGYRVADGIMNQVRSITFNLLLFVTRFAPAGNKFWKGVINAGYKGLVKSTKGAEGVGHIVKEGRIKHKPVAYKGDGGDGPIDDARWITNDGDWFKSPSNAKSTYLAAGRVPSIWASSSENELGNHIAAETAEVLDVGNEEFVFGDAQILHNQITVKGNPQQGQAMADGGNATAKHQTKEHVSVEHPGSLKDTLVPLGTEADGRVVSMEKFYQVFGQHADSEEMEEQHMMGKLEEKDPGADRAFVIKVLLIAAALVGMFVLGPPLIQALLGGGGGGGGGSVIPLLLGV